MYQAQAPIAVAAMLRAMATGMTPADFEKKLREGREAHRAAREQAPQGGGK